MPGIIEKAMPLDASNVMVVCTECGKPTRIAHERVPMGTDQKERTRRVCKKCGKPIAEHTREA
jgi:large subunit ribosomal protein L24